MEKEDLIDRFEKEVRCEAIKEVIDMLKGKRYIFTDNVKNKKHNEITNNLIKDLEELIKK